MCYTAPVPEYVPQGDYFLRVLMFEMFADMHKNAKFCTRKQKFY